MVPMSNIAMETQNSNSKLDTAPITIGFNRKLTLKDAKLLSMNQATVQLNLESIKPMELSYHFLKSCIENRMPIYGINTQFGDQVNLFDTHIKDDSAIYYESIFARQENLIKSHSCGLGEIVPSKFIKVAMMLRAHCLAQGYSGVSDKTVKTLLAFLEAGISPIVRHYGSIGASGDLIPLAMIAAGIIGDDVDVLYQNEIMKAPEAIFKSGLTKLKPEMRDGLAMINGTSFMTAIASVALYDLKRLFKQMLSAVAMSLESMLVISSAYHPLVHRLKHHSGELSVNEFMLNFWKGSQLLSDLDEVRQTNVKPVQDYYSLRSVCQGFGVFFENLERATTWVENEMNSVNDNPIIDVQNKKIHHGANFMGFYITDSCDMLKTNIAQASTWLHALLANMVHPRKNHNLPTNLVKHPEKHNGFRPIQLLAAALAVQNRKLAESHQSFTLPTEGDNQDVNSLGTHAAFDLYDAVTNLEHLTAILLVASTQALELRDINLAGTQSQLIYKKVRQISPTLSECRPMTEEINAIVAMMAQETF